MRAAVLPLTLLLAVALAACSNTSALEDRVARLETELRSRPAIGDMIVVGREEKPLLAVTQTCFRYRAFDQVQETCARGSSFGETAGGRCIKEAEVGKPLPLSCR